MNLIASFKKFGLTLLAMFAFAGATVAATNSTDNTFGPILTMVQNWAEGSLGKTLAIAAFLIGMGMGIVRQSAMAVVLGITFALVLAYGPGVILSIFSFGI